jgi:hypothetical protein
MIMPSAAEWNNAAGPRRADALSCPLATDKELTDFLRGAERRAFKRTAYAVRDDDAALDIVQDAMIRLAQSYGERPIGELPLIFGRILSNATMDCRGCVAPPCRTSPICWAAPPMAIKPCWKVWRASTANGWHKRLNCSCRVRKRWA